jgi:hypothetical protein
MIMSTTTRDMGKGATWGALFGLWSGAWLLAVPAATECVMRTWDGVGDLVITRAWLAGRIARHLGLTSAPIVSALVLLVAACAGIAAAAACLLSALRVDPEHVARRSMTWSVRPFFRPNPYWLYCCAAVTLTNALDARLNWYVFVAILAVVPLWMAVLPLGILRRGVAFSTTGAGWWAPRWPGLQVILAALLPWLASVGIDIAADAVTGRLSWLVWLPVWLVNCVAALGASVALVLGLSPSELWRQGRRWLAPRVLAPFLWLGLRLALLWIWVVPATVCFYILLWKVVPVLATLLQSQGGSLPLAIAATVNILNWIGRFWWLVLPPLWLPYQMLVSARFVALAFPGAEASKLGG